jgi:predicted glycogen debranching enzyme
VLRVQPATLPCKAMTDPGRTHDVRVTGDALDLLDREWLITNGTGAFAMGTLPGVNTRRYHGLFVAAARPPVGRIVTLNQVLEFLHVRWPDGEHTVELGACAFRNNDELFAPKGYKYLTRFERGLGVAWTYTWRMIQLRREVMLHWKEQAATVRYVVSWTPGTSGGVLPIEVTLRLSPMLTLRDFHSLLHQSGAASFDVQADGDTLIVRRDGVAVTLRCPDAAFRGEPRWWYNLHYPVETQRGQDDREDAFVPGNFVLDLGPGEDRELTLTVALGDTPAEPRTEHDARLEHLTPIADALGAPGSADDAEARLLAIASDDFVVDRTIKGERLSTIIAGYPWFADWGRDTFIALPGLLLATARFNEAKATLRAFAEAIRGGLVPNRFDDYDDAAAHYNTVDASLWFVHAAMRYVEASGDRDAWNDWLAAACLNVMEAYIAGTDFDIRMTGDCLISAGSPGTQLTWMDAARDGVVFTPRHGKAVEINALWYSALVGMAGLLASDQPDTAAHFKKLASRANRSFVKVFWNDAADCLFDHVWTDDQGVDHPDASIRPNQVFVASLPHSPLPQTRQRQVLKVVRDRLLTPVGLRTLPPDDPKYHAHFRGDMFHRDEAYHQGTVWAWLIGPYAEAVLRTGRFSDKARRDARAAIQPLLDRMAGEGLGQLHEVFDADPPHTPVGCVAQAWSVAEVLRVKAMIDRENAVTGERVPHKAATAGRAPQTATNGRFMGSATNGRGFLSAQPQLA